MANVLIVEDDRDLATLLSIRLKKAGHDVSREADGASGLAAVTAIHPDVVIVDWMMPGLSGIDVCTAIRNDPALERTPVLMLTAKTSPADAEVAVGAGVDAFLSKPCSTAELLQRVNAVLESRRAS